jgi:uncharacterized damage-inducible protein DinB
MTAEHFRRLFAYNAWANARVWAHIMALSDEQYHQPSAYSIGSVHQQIVHQVEVEGLLYRRALQKPHESLRKPDSFADRAAVRARWDAISADWTAALAVVTDAQLDAVVEYTSLSAGKSYRNPMWEIVYQCLNHSTDHRAQILALIGSMGGETSGQDFIGFSWEQPSV